MSRLAATWPGPAGLEARAAYERARQSGMSAGRALVLGCIASWKDGWAFRRSLAEHTGLCVRTVQRAISQAKMQGLLGVARAKRNEVPPGAEGPISCGWSHRWTIGWGQAYEAAKAAVAETRLARAVKAAARGVGAMTDRLHASPAGTHSGDSRGRVTPRAYHEGRWTASELDAELERLAAVKRRPD